MLVMRFPRACLSLSLMMLWVTHVASHSVHVSVTVDDADAPESFSAPFQDSEVELKQMQWTFPLPYTAIPSVAFEHGIIEISPSDGLSVDSAAATDVSAPAHQGAAPGLYESCQATLGSSSLTGRCLPLSLCRFGTPIPGHCAGTRTVQCCLFRADDMTLVPQTNAEWQSKFALWAKIHEREYPPSEYRMRFDLFVKSAKIVHTHNQNYMARRSTYGLALRDRADRSTSELSVPKPVHHHTVPEQLSKSSYAATHPHAHERYPSHSAGGYASKTPITHRRAPANRPTLVDDGPWSPQGVPCEVQYLKGTGTCTFEYSKCDHWGVNMGDFLCPTGQYSRAQSCCVTKEQAQQVRDNPYVPMVPFDPPATVDWRIHPDFSVVTPIKDQGSCGSCYAHAGAEVLESRWALHTQQAAKPVAIQQFLLTNDDKEYCHGGFSEHFWTYVSQRGICAESDFPYTAKAYPYTTMPNVPPVASEVQDALSRQNTCTKIIPAWSTEQSPSDVDTIISLFTKYGLSAPADVSSAYASITHNLLNSAVGVAAMEAAVREGPVMFAMALPDDFVHYSEGVYSPSGACQGVGQNANISHAMVIEGFGHDTKSGLDYWLIRNSWALSWGSNGYIRVVKGANMCDIETAPVQWPSFNSSFISTYLNTLQSCKEGYCSSYNFCQKTLGLRPVESFGKCHENNDHSGYSVCCEKH